jgi:lysyl-tRNA synthetase class 2
VIIDTLTKLRLGESAVVQGRIIATRRFGQVTFCRLGDASGSVQLVIEGDCPPLVSVGNLVRAEGVYQSTRTGENSLLVWSLTLLGECSETLHFKMGLRSTPQRPPERHLDLLLNPSIREFIHRCSRCKSGLRQELLNRGFDEWDTSTLQPSFDAGFARPFTTELHTYKQTCSLRLTSEIRLKQLLVAGFEKVFELGKSFRNGGIDKLHCPEHTLLECYQAYATSADLVALTEELLFAVATQVFPGPTRLGTLLPPPPWPRVTVLEAAGKVFTATPFRLDWTKEELLAFLAVEGRGCVFTPQLSLGQLYWDCIQKLILPHLPGPVFISGFPTSMSLFAKWDNDVADKTALVIDGSRIADISTDENDYDQVKERLDEQALLTKRTPNPEFLHALRCGIPPLAGMAIGLERFLICMADASIPMDVREAILFPLARGRRASHGPK